MGGAELARTLRERRRELGLTRTRLAERSGLAAADIARWERGDEVPPPIELIVLADAVGLDPTETEAWIDDAVTIDIAGPEVEIEIVKGRHPSANPFDERTRLIRSSPRLFDRVLARIEELRAGRGTTSSLGRLDPSTRPAKPAPSARTGLVAPPTRTPGMMPDVRGGGHDPAVRVYSTTPPPISEEQQEAFYRTRRMGTAATLVGLAIALWWAFGALGDGVSELLELFRGPSETTLGGLP
jgi:transcriptional regulator with XRE-family HTH domain